MVAVGSNVFETEQYFRKTIGGFYGFIFLNLPSK
jgi:hypothetical protein